MMPTSRLPDKRLEAAIDYARNRVESKLNDRSHLLILAGIFTLFVTWTTFFLFKYPLGLEDDSFWRGFGVGSFYLGMWAVVAIAKLVAHDRREYDVFRHLLELKALRHETYPEKLSSASNKDE